MVGRIGNGIFMSADVNERRERIIERKTGMVKKFRDDDSMFALLVLYYMSD